MPQITQEKKKKKKTWKSKDKYYLKKLPSRLLLEVGGRAKILSEYYFQTSI